MTVGFALFKLCVKPTILERNRSAKDCFFCGLVSLLDVCENNMFCVVLDWGLDSTMFLSQRTKSKCGLRGYFAKASRSVFTCADCMHAGPHPRPMG